MNNNIESILAKQNKITVASHAEHGIILILEKVKIYSNPGDYFLVLDTAGSIHTVNPSVLNLFPQKEGNKIWEESFKKYFVES